MIKEKKARRQDRWEEKKGITAKTYKVNKQVAEDFKEACKQVGVGMGPQLTTMMQEFIQSVSDSDTRKESL